jgi:hypothetical protein
VVKFCHHHVLQFYAYPGKLLHPVKMSGAQVVDSEIAIESAAREGIRCINCERQTLEMVPIQWYHFLTGSA